MQSDRNSYCGDVVLDSLDMAYRVEDSIWDQKYKRQIFRNLYYEDFKIEENPYLKKYST